MKYHTPKSEDDILPNKLGLADPDKIAEKKVPEYIKAVQSAAEKNYQPMIQFFRTLEK